MLRAVTFGLAAVLSSCSVRTASAIKLSGSLLFRTWGDDDSGSPETTTIQRWEIASNNSVIVTTLPVQESFITYGSVVDRAAGLWYSSSVVGDNPYTFPADLTVVNLTSGLPIRTVSSVFCATLFLRQGQLYCISPSPWYVPPGHSSSDLITSLLSIDPVSGSYTFLMTLPIGFTPSYCPGVYDPTTDTLQMQVGTEVLTRKWVILDMSQSPPTVSHITNLADDYAWYTASMHPDQPGSVVGLLFNAPTPRVQFVMSQIFAVNGTWSIIGSNPTNLSPRYMEARDQDIQPADTTSGTPAIAWLIMEDANINQYIVGVEMEGGTVVYADEISQIVCPNITPGGTAQCIVADIVWVPSV